jgi:hypothetical protein
MKDVKNIILILLFLLFGPGFSQNSDTLITVDGVIVDQRQNGFAGQSIRLWITSLPSAFDVIDENSRFSLSFPRELVGVEKRPGVHIPKLFDLSPTWPNPGNQVIRWDYSMPWSCFLATLFAPGLTAALTSRTSPETLQCSTCLPTATLRGTS